MDTATIGGLPQHRERVYVIGIRRDCQHREFRWPEPISQKMTLTDVLGPTESEVRVDLRQMTHDDDGMPLSQTVRKNLADFQSFLNEHPEMQGRDFIVDVGGSKVHWMENQCPCLTASRCKSKHGFWSHARARFLKPRDFLRLQGVWDTAYGSEQAFACVPRTTLGEMAGNAMSLCVVQRLVRAILVARGIFQK